MIIGSIGAHDVIHYVAGCNDCHRALVVDELLPERVIKLGWDNPVLPSRESTIHS